MVDDYKALPKMRKTFPSVMDNQKGLWDLTLSFLSHPDYDDEVSDPRC
jgi:hypothetical protein